MGWDGIRERDGAGAGNRDGDGNEDRSAEYLKDSFWTPAALVVHVT